MNPRATLTTGPQGSHSPAAAPDQETAWHLTEGTPRLERCLSPDWKSPVCLWGPDTPKQETLKKPRCSGGRWLPTSYGSPHPHQRVSPFAFRHPHGLHPVQLGGGPLPSTQGARTPKEVPAGTLLKLRKAQLDICPRGGGSGRGAPDQQEARAVAWRPALRLWPHHPERPELL